MSLKDLSSSERDTALQCMRYVLESDCFEGDEFHTRLGLTQAELAMVISKWPLLNDEERENPDNMAVNNCFNEVCNGISLSNQEREKWFSVSIATVCETFAHWRQTVGR